MKKMKNNLDERQELTLLKIEHTGCWIAFWGLLIAIILQMVLVDDGSKSLLGEWCVLMLLSVYMVFGCLKNGIWDRRLKPNLKTNMIVSGIAATVTAVIYTVVFYRNYHNLIGSAAIGAFMFLMTGAVCLAVLMFFSRIYEKRSQYLEDPQEDAGDEE